MRALRLAGLTPSSNQSIGYRCAIPRLEEGVSPARRRRYTSDWLQLPMSNDALMSQARKVALLARDHGGRALLVGCYVRDLLLGLAPKDADLEVYGIEAEA